MITCHKIPTSFESIPVLDMGIFSSSLAVESTISVNELEGQEFFSQFYCIKRPVLINRFNFSDIFLLKVSFFCFKLIIIIIIIIIIYYYYYYLFHP
jgi:hypothetical protein